MTYTMHFRRHFKSAIADALKAYSDSESQASATDQETPEWCRAIEERCRADDPAGALAIIRELEEPSNEVYEATVTVLRLARTWDASRGLLRVSDRDLLQRAQARYPNSVEEWACVRLLLDTHVELEPVLRTVSYHRLPERVRSVARASIWGAVHQAIGARYPWLTDPVAELEAQRLLGYAGTPMEFHERTVAFWTERLRAPQADASPGEAAQ